MKISQHTKNVFSLSYPLLLNLLLTSMLVPVCIGSVKWLDMKFVYLSYIALVLGIASLFVTTWLTFVRLLEYDRLLANIIRIGAKSILNVKLDIPMQRLSHTRARRRVFAKGLTMLKHPIGEPLEHTNSACLSKGSNFKLFPIFSKGWWKATFTPANLL